MNLESITNALLTFQRLKQLYSPPQRDEESQDDSTLQPDRLILLQDTLGAIANFIPATRGGSFSEAFRLGRHYSSTYREIKQHVRNMNGSSFDTASDSENPEDNRSGVQQPAKGLHGQSDSNIRYIGIIKLDFKAVQKDNTKRMTKQ